MTSVYLVLEAHSPSGEWRPAPEPRGDTLGYVPAGRVLVVDDEAIVRSWIARLLQAEGHSVQEAGDGAEALQMVGSDPVGFDLIITDIRMPVVNGWELGRRIQERWSNLPVLYISGYDLEQPGRHGGTFLRKPFEPDELVRMVGDLLRDSQLDA
jgi:CheY-like chemotaxis protein